MDNRRRAQRYTVENVRGSLIFSVDARILNMSLAGMAVETASNLRVGRSYGFRLAHGEAEGLRLTGAVVWCRLRAIRKGAAGERAPVYEAGILFEGVLSPHAGELLAFLRNSAIVPLQQRLIGRFHLRQVSAVSLEAEYEFVVRTISASGMLIETELLPALGAVFEMRVQLNGETLVASGRVAFVREAGELDQDQQAAVGVEFVAMSQEDRLALEEFIDRQLAA
ncbi:MAG: PilZ domain-containing protein [Acidobacteriota bacterium]